MAKHIKATMGGKRPIDEVDDASEDEIDYEDMPDVEGELYAGARTGFTEQRLTDLAVNDDLTQKFFQEHDYGNMPVSKDNNMRPIWLSPDSHIFLETYGDKRMYLTAYDFLISIAEPECRPRLVHEYKLTPYSLYAAVSVGVSADDILRVLGRLSKNGVPEAVRQNILSFTGNIGKVKLVLKTNRYFIESPHPAILQKLLRDPVIAGARAANSELVASTAPKLDYEVAGMSKDGKKDTEEEPELALKDLLERAEGDDDDVDSDVDEDKAGPVVHSFEVEREKIEDVKRHCITIDMPLLEEYDFRNDTTSKSLDMDLKPQTVLRPYQEKSLAKMFGNGRGRSGIIVLPCGAGKTLTGVTIACTIKKSVLVLCTSSVAVEQWRRQFCMWSTVSDDNIVRFTSTSKDEPVETSITISTYTMVAFTGKRSYEAEKVMNHLQDTEWGLLLMDEVHVVPANMFRKVLTNTSAQCKVGLTATLVREDDKIADLNFLIGPKLYEANWMDLQNEGFLAKVKCWEVWCDMTPEFYYHYLRQTNRKRMLLWATNPNKYRTAYFLAEKHANAGDKVIIFSDNVFALKKFAVMMGMPYICGDTQHKERMVVLDLFTNNSRVNIIFISKVGDNSIDLPDANVLIQVSSMYGSRRQEAQRLGRILRAKKGQPKPGPEDYNAHFYSLVSKDTAEMYFSTKRQQFLVDQGYAFEVIDKVPGMDKYGILTKAQEKNLLAAVLDAMDNETQEEDLSGFDPDTVGRKAGRRKGNLSGLSGGEGMVYNEYKSKQPKARHALFKHRDKR